MNPREGNGYPDVQEESNAKESPCHSISYLLLRIGFGLIQTHTGRKSLHGESNGCKIEIEAFVQQFVAYLHQPKRAREEQKDCKSSGRTTGAGPARFDYSP